MFKKDNYLLLKASTDEGYARMLIRGLLKDVTVLLEGKEENVVVRFRAEAESRAMRAPGFVTYFSLKDLKIKWETPMRLYSDNKLLINIAHNLI